jgi:hypothetical protein
MPDIFVRNLVTVLSILVLVLPFSSHFQITCI